MTTPSISSTPILRAALLWGAVITTVIAVVGGLIGLLTAGTNGLLSALVGAVLAAVFTLLTTASILIANRGYGSDSFLPVFFGVVLGGWLLKLVVFIVALIVLRGQPWVVPVAFFLALVAGVVGSLIVDVVVMQRMRLPHASDVVLPGDDETEQN